MQENRMTSRRILSVLNNYRMRDGIFVVEKGDQLLRFVKSGEDNLYYMDATVASKAQEMNVMTKVYFVFEEEYLDGSDSEDDIPSLHKRDDDSSSDEESDSDDDSYDIHGTYQGSNDETSMLKLVEDQFEDNELEVYGMGYESGDDGDNWTAVGDIMKFPGYDKIMQTTADVGGGDQEQTGIVSDIESDEDKDEDNVTETVDESVTKKSTTNET